MSRDHQRAARDDEFDTAWLHPRYWPSWIGCALIALLGILPWWLQRRIGSSLGRLAYRLIPRRVHDTRVNLSLCFPELGEDEREAMIRDIFRQGGIGAFETASAWFKPAACYRSRIRAVGVEHVTEAARAGKGVIILGAHYSGLDLNGAAAALCFPLHVIYRPQNNPVFDYLIRMRRRRIYAGQLDHDNMRGLFKTLKSGAIVWTSVDQDFGLKQGVMAPFFGYPAATLTATSRMARINGSPVLFTHFMRNPDENTYTLTFTPVLPDYPCGDDTLDARRMNHMLEQLIRRAPTQYMWFHRRFKNRPPGEPSPYVKK